MRYANIQKPEKKKQNLINEELLRFPEVMLIGEDGLSYGVTKIKEALKIADDKEFDLVCLNPTATPPVCKLMDYSKYLFEKDRKLKEAKKNQKNAEIKEIQISPVIADNDFNLKIKQARKFLERGDKVKVTIFKKKVRNLKTQAEQKLYDFVEACSDVSTCPTKEIAFDGKNYAINLVPKKKSPSKKEEQPQADNNN